MGHVPKPDRHIGKVYPLPEFIEKLRRFADTLEQGRCLGTKIAGERTFVPVEAACNLEHEWEDVEEEIEAQIKSGSKIDGDPAWFGAPT